MSWLANTVKYAQAKSAHDGTPLGEAAQEYLDGLGDALQQAMIVQHEKEQMMTIPPPTPPVLPTLRKEEGPHPRTFMLMRLANGWSIRLFRITAMPTQDVGTVPLGDVYIAKDLDLARNLIEWLSQGGGDTEPSL